MFLPTHVAEYSQRSETTRIVLGVKFVEQSQHCHQHHNKQNDNSPSNRRKLFNVAPTIDISAGFW